MAKDEEKQVMDPLADAADADAVDFDDEEEIVVEFEDENGEKYFYTQEMLLEVNGETYALLVGEDECECEHEHGECGCGHDHEHDEDECECDVRFAKIIHGENGEDEYVEPTDEEFDAVCEAYNALWDDDDEQ